MAQFLGSIAGQRGPASRLGSKKSGLDVVAASWEGSVRVYLRHDEETGIGTATVRLEPRHGAGVSRLLYDGPVSGK